jgi:hypothetical protein
MKIVMASAGLLALGTIGVTTAHAQMSGKPWTISATLRGFYDDNYADAPTHPTPGTPGPRGSYGFELNPSASVKIAPDPQTSLALNYDFSMRYYDDRPKNKADYSHDFELMFNHEFNERYALALSDSFVIAQEPELIDPVLSNPIRANGNNIRNDGAITLNAKLTPLFGLALGYRNTFYDYENSGPQSLSAELDRIENVVTIDTRWELPSDITGIIGYQFTAIDHTSQDSLNAAGAPYLSPSVRDAYLHTAYVGAEHSFRSDLKGKIKVGVEYADYYNSTQSGAFNPYVDLSLNYQYSDAGLLTFGYRNARNQTDADSLNGAAITSGTVVEDQESSTVYAAISHKITPKLTASLNGQFQSSTFNGGALDGQTDDFYMLGLNLRYQFNHFFSSEVGYDYDRLNSEVVNRGFNRNRVYLGITAAY